MKSCNSIAAKGINLGELVSENGAGAIDGKRSCVEKSVQVEASGGGGREKKAIQLKSRVSRSIEK